MRLNRNEMRIRAEAFAKEWKDAVYEKGETQSFYNDFFEIFGIKRRSVARYEEHVKKLNNKTGFIDLFWPKTLLVEQKSAGRSLEDAAKQAGEYFDAIAEEDKPRFQLCCDFQNFDLLDRDERKSWSFKLADLKDNIDLFGFIFGFSKIEIKDQDPVNIKAAEKIGALHDALEASGYRGHKLEVFLVRLVFCLFADDTGIFEPKDILLDFLTNRTREDGSDLGLWLGQLFQTLNTPPTDRQSTLDEDLSQFPYVNGSLFEEALPLPSFSSKMRNALVDAANFNWSAVSPAIFGSLFQSVMNDEERRMFGAHYTTERDILKVIQPLFMNDLNHEFDQIVASKTGKSPKLKALQKKISSFKILDPACGCGNFLVIAYRELRELELKIIRELHSAKQIDMFSDSLSLVDVDQFYGFEVEEFPSRIAEISMWMMDHIMNRKLSVEFGQYYVRIPLRKSPHITYGNALDIDWNKALPAKKCSYIIGNPPFRGHQWRTSDQQADMARIWGKDGQVNRLDYVTCWFKKAVEYTLKNKEIDIAFVSTNSITQGEQCGILWPAIFKYGVTIRFAHRTFQWNSEARGKAAVHCVIIGLTWDHKAQKTIYEYIDIKGLPHASPVKQINGYLFDGPQYAVPARSRPPTGRLQMFKGSQPTDGARTKVNGILVTTSNLILDENEKNRAVARDPSIKKWLKPFVGTDELISGEYRWCLWLKNADPKAIASSPEIQERLDRVRAGRMKSPTPSVQQYANYPTLFTQDRQPSKEYLAYPEVSSENREYVPIAYLPPTVIASNKLQIIPDAPLHYFSMMTSAMHMGWMRTVCGRLESRYSYAPAVYNSFIWPELKPANIKKLNELGQNILDVRKEFFATGSNFDTLYDPMTMPPKLRQAHQKLDDYVDKLYRKGGFKFERERVEFLFDLYAKSVEEKQKTMEV